MLGIHGLGREADRYYLSDPGWQLPAPVPAAWAGTGAAAMGLQGALEPEGFRRLLEGCHPATGRPIGSGRTRVAAFDLTFSAPKSASVLLASGDDVARRVLAAHGEAVAGALAYLDRHAVTAVRGAGPERIVLPTGGTIAATFTHAVNRNGDPHLHSHVVMANLVHGADGRWSACDRRGLDAHRTAAAAVYEAHLRAAVTAALGLRWSGPPRSVPEVVGVPPQLLGEFSSRRAEIRRLRHEQGAGRGRGSRSAWATTRAPKDPAPPYGALVGEWRRRARAAAHVDLTLVRPGVPARDAGLVDEHRFAAVISLTPHGGARRRDVVAAFAAGAVDGIGAGALERLVDAWVPAGPVGVREPLQPRRTVVPAGHLLHALGARPLDPDAHEVWRGAARAVEDYRARWGLRRSVEALGPASPVALAALPPARLADRTRAQHQLAAARARLGRREPAGPELGLAR